MIRDKREQERKDVDESERREKRSHKEQQTGDRAAPAPKPQPDQQRQRREREQPLPRLHGVHRPSRIDEDQVRRPDELAQVEPDDASREQTALSQGQRKIGALSADAGALEPGGQPAGGAGEREPWRQRNHVAPPRKTAALPPEDHQQRGGQRRGDGLGQERDGKQAGGQGIGCALPLVVEAQIGERRGEIEHGRNRILLFGDPGDRFNTHRMQCKQQRRQPGAAHRESAQGDSQQTSRSGMKQNVQDMVARRPVPPEEMLHPECRVQKRVVLLRGTDLAPDASQALE